MLPATKLDTRTAKLQDLLNPPSEIELQRMISESKAELARTTSSELAARLHDFIAAAYGRRGAWEDGYHHAKIAMRLLHTRVMVHNAGSMAISTGRTEEALQLFTEAAELPPERAEFLGDELCLYGNLAEALQQLGDNEGAVEAFGNAVAVADHADPNSLFFLATQAATLGLGAEAMEFLARAFGCRLGIRVAGDAAEFVLAHLSDFPTVFRQAPVAHLAALVAAYTEQSDEWIKMARLAAQLPVNRGRSGDRERLAAEIAPYIAATVGAVTGGKP